MEKKSKLELSYSDDNNIQTYTMQVNDAEHNIFNKSLFDNRRDINAVRIALQCLAESSVCTKHHKSKINDIINKTTSINFRLIG